MSINLNIISKKRGELMGIATFFIILCHAPAHIPTMPSLLSDILGKFSYGVDVFLFLSGVGLCFSFSKVSTSTDLLLWYKKRFLRILLPCLIVQIVFLNKPNIISHILFLIGYSYYANHDGFWFVDMLIPLYLFTPVFCKIAQSKFGVLLLAIVVS